MKPPICNGFEMIVPLLFNAPLAILFPRQAYRKDKRDERRPRHPMIRAYPNTEKMTPALILPVGKTDEQVICPLISAPAPPGKVGLLTGSNCP